MVATVAKKVKKEALDKRGQEVIRDKQGRFPKGQSGNPRGRPLGAKNRIVKAKQELEVLLREEIVNADQIRNVWLSMLAEAQNGNVSAAKLILDKVMSNARVDEEVSAEGSGITIKIENVTLPGHGIEEKPIEGDYTNVEDEDNGEATQP